MTHSSATSSKSSFKEKHNKLFFVNIPDETKYNVNILYTQCMRWFYYIQLYNFYNDNQLTFLMKSSPQLSLYSQSLSAMVDRK